MNDYSDYETMYHQTVAERVRLRQIKAELLAALEQFDAAFGVLVDGGSDIDSADAGGWLAIARAALTKANQTAA